MSGVGAPVVVPRHSVTPERSRDASQAAGQRVDLEGHQGDEVSAEEKNVGTCGMQGDTDSTEERWVRGPAWKSEAYMIVRGATGAHPWETEIR